MFLYKLTDAERAAIEALNSSRLNVIMVVCDFGGEIGCAVVRDDLDKECFADYREVLGETLDVSRIVKAPVFDL